MTDARKHSYARTNFRRRTDDLGIADFRDFVQRRHGLDHILNNRRDRERLLYLMNVPRVHEGLAFGDYAAIAQALDRLSLNRIRDVVSLYRIATIANTSSHHILLITQGARNESSLLAFSVKCRAMIEMLDRFPDDVDYQPDALNEPFWVLRLRHVYTRGLHVQQSVLDRYRTEA
jgi:hypothetical protein